MNDLIAESKALEEKLHAAWRPIAVRHQYGDPYVIRLAALITRAYQRWLRRQEKFGSVD